MNNNKGNDANIILDVGVDESKLLKQHKSPKEVLESIKVEENVSDEEMFYAVLGKEVKGLVESVNKLVESAEEREYLLEMQQAIIKELEEELNKCNQQLDEFNSKE